MKDEEGFDDSKDPCLENTNERREVVSCIRGIKKRTLCWVKFVIVFAVLTLLSIIVAIPLSLKHEDNQQIKIGGLKGCEDGNSCAQGNKTCKFFDIKDADDPLKDNCTLGSEHVQKRCHQKVTDCWQCPNGNKLPPLCFCDMANPSHCGVDDVDHPKKMKCEECQDNCPCLNGGSCICNGSLGTDIKCICQTGFIGPYCEVIVRKCNKVQELSKGVRECNGNAYDLCSMTLQFELLECFRIIDEKDMKKGLRNCTRS